MDTPRWNLYRYINAVWASELCPGHKLVLLALMHYMRSDRLFAYPGLENLRKDTSMSRTKLVAYLKDLKTAGWLDRSSPPEGTMTQPGREPNCYYLPPRGRVPVLPPHCLQVRTGHLNNLRRGPSSKDSLNG